MGHTARGFTLIEATITLAIMALAASVVIPAVSNITKAELRASASKLAGLMRQTYDDAALNAQTRRLVFDFESRTIGVETTEKVLAFEPGSNVLADAAQARAELNELTRVPPELQSMLAADDEDDGDEEVEAGGLSALTAMLAIGDLGGGSGMSTDGEAFQKGEGATLTLDESVRLLDVWVQGMDQAAVEGVVYLYFFPHGYTQDAIIHLEDQDGGDVFSVRVSALTGRTKIFGEYIEVPK